MKSWIIAAGVVVAAASCIPNAAAGEDSQAGTPLAPNEAAGAWTVQSEGQDLCVLTLKADKTAAGYAAQVPAGCRDVLGVAPTGWRPTADGMQFVDASGAALVGFNRWSNSLFVAHRKSGLDVQLRRGGAELARSEVEQR